MIHEGNEERGLLGREGRRVQKARISGLYPGTYSTLVRKVALQKNGR